MTKKKEPEDPMQFVRVFRADGTEKRFWSVTEAAEAWSTPEHPCSRTTVIKYIKQKRIPGVEQPAGTYLIPFGSQRPPRVERGAFVGTEASTVWDRGTKKAKP